MKAKRFDCVAMKRRGAQIIYERTKEMTLEEEVEFWQARTSELRKQQQKLHEKKEGPGAGRSES